MDLSRLSKSFINCSRPRTFLYFFFLQATLSIFSHIFFVFIFLVNIFYFFCVTILLLLWDISAIRQYTNILSETTRNLRPVRYAISTILNLVYLRHKRKQTSSLNERCCLIHSLLKHFTYCERKRENDRSFGARQNSLTNHYTL